MDVSNLAFIVGCGSRRVKMRLEGDLSPKSYLQNVFGNIGNQVDDSMDHWNKRIVLKSSIDRGTSKEYLFDISRSIVD